MRHQQQSYEHQQIVGQEQDTLVNELFSLATGCTKGKPVSLPAEEVLTPTHQLALWWHEQGMNVFSLPYGKKSGFRHRRLQSTRLCYSPTDRHREDLLRVKLTVNYVTNQA